MTPQLLHSRSGRIMALMAFIFTGVGLWALSTEPATVFLTKAWLYIWFAFFAWLLFWNPSVRVSESEIVVDNIFRRNKLNWSAIKRIDTKYSLTIETEQGTIKAFAAPAPSRYAGLMANRTEAENLPESTFIGKGLIRPGDLTSSDSGVAAYVIRRHYEKLRDRNQLNDAASVQTTWVYSRVILFVLLFVAAVVGFIS